MAHRHDQPPPRPPWGGPGWGPRPGWVPPWAQGGWSRPAGPPGWGPPGPTGIRIGNAERTEVTNALVRHMAEGRLTEEELEERMAQANAAKTAEDLRPLLADLPPLDTGEPAPPPPRRRRPVLVWVLAVVAALWVLGASARFGHVFLPIGFFPPFPLIVVAVVAFMVLRRRHRYH